MLSRKINVLLSFIPVLIVMVAASCGPVGPQPGTPEFHWKAATETFTAGDYNKTAENLHSLTREENEFLDRALPWRLVVTSGLVRAYTELADNFEAGARANKANPGPFRTQMNTYRRVAGQRALEFIETFGQFSERDRGEEIPLDFPYPRGSPAEVAELARVANGMLLPEAAIQAAEGRVIARGMSLATAQAAGAKEDVARTLSIFQAGDVRVPHDTFVLAMVSNVYEQAHLFGRTKLDLPDRVELLCSQGLQILKSIEQTEEAKTLARGLEQALKNARKR